MGWARRSLALEKSKRKCGSWSGETNDQWNKACQCIVREPLSVWQENSILLPSRARRRGRHGDGYLAPPRFCTFWCANEKISSPCDAGCVVLAHQPPRETRTTTLRGVTVRTAEPVRWLQSFDSCCSPFLFEVRKLIYTFPDKTSQPNYRREPLCWQRWNPGRGNIYLERF